LYLESDLRAIYSRFQLYGIIAVVFIILSILFAYFFSKRLQQTISDPIMDLAKAAKTISENRDYTVRVTRRTSDELGILTDAFNQMLIEIETQNLEITAFNHRLEEKVAHRTSELEKANIILKQQNAFIETIIDASVDLIGVFDKELHIVVLNKKADEIYKIKREAFIGLHILEAFPQLKDSAMLHNLKSAFEGHTIRDANYTSVISHRNFENFYVPLRDKNNEVYRVLVIGHDITDIIAANEKLTLLNKELEKSNRDLEQFAYIASHDLQEPLRKIQIFSELGGKNLQSPAVLQTYLEKINSSAERMTDLIKAVLNYSRLSDAGTVFSKIDLNQTLQLVTKDLDLQIEEKKAIIKSGDLPVISGNQLQINQLFQNLISNSLKFTEQQPEITISASILRADKVKNEAKLPGGKYIELVFRDNGIGFDKKYNSKIFSIFQRLHGNRSYPGTGIGLALCKKIVENHHGCITAESEPGKGTTFFIYLPVEPARNQADQ
jgi:two-component system CheB/CheR fusion protein